MDMETLKNLEKAMNEAQKVAMDAYNKLHDALNAEASKICGFKVGDKVIQKAGNTRRQMERRFVIRAILGELNAKGEIYYRLIGQPLKKDGTPALREETTIWKWDGELKLLDAPSVDAQEPSKLA